MKKIGVIIISVVLAACTAVPVTQRRQLRLVDQQQINSESAVAYNEYIAANNTLSPFTPEYKRVSSVGKKLVEGCEKYMRQHNNQAYLSLYDWEFNVVEDPQLNAFCMPGGKIVVFTGLLNEFKDDEALAVVLSHEIAHAIANHSSEQISQQMLIASVGTILQTVADVSVDNNTVLVSSMLVNLYGLGAGVGMLKFSRTHESEADKMGLVFMEFAGYNSNAAIPFWEQMLAENGDGGPEFFQTHPSPANRIQIIKEYIPVAKSFAIN